MQRHPLPAWLRSKPGHSHEGDLPSRMLKWAMLPVYVLAAVWDRAFGGMDDAVDAFERHWGSTPLSAWKEALSDWWHQLRNPENATAAVNADSIPAIACEPGLSHAWQQTQVDFRIEQFKVRHLNAVVGSKTAAEKREALTALQQSVKNALDADSIDSAVRSTFQDESINAHRFFASSRPTATRGFVEALPAKVLMPQSA
ncbi:hypothetical protein Lgee_2135 [Legionella geestiana]|uniref:Uncharacterized protein n=3 Tax=Legionella geestiana TaxID=45065 RepID=A0A0W0TLG3_9GAMM|nr:hypothetical protein Lgee_2135 [Legionella geestiana]